MGGGKLFGLGRANPPDLPRDGEKEVEMRLIKRLAVAFGSLLALVLAGGAHIKVG